MLFSCCYSYLSLLLFLFVAMDFSIYIIYFDVIVVVGENLDPQIVSPTFTL